MGENAENLRLLRQELRYDVLDNAARQEIEGDVAAPNGYLMRLKDQTAAKGR